MNPFAQTLDRRQFLGRLSATTLILGGHLPAAFDREGQLTRKSEEPHAARNS